VTNSGEKVQALGRKSKHQERARKSEMRAMEESQTIITLRCSFVPLEKSIGFSSPPFTSTPQMKK